LTLDQTIIKEINARDEVTYTAYDVLTLSSSSFRPDDKVFVIVDNEPFQMTIKRNEYENFKSISEDKKDIMAADSSSVSVVTGYSESSGKIARFSYEIPEEVISKIKVANQILLRYYSGPSMITVKPGGGNLKKLKKLIDIK
jgi:hypothetical protein